jgi:hypothetical protein
MEISTDLVCYQVRAQGRWGEICCSRIGIKITVFLEVTPCSLVARYQTTRRNEKHVVFINWCYMKKEAEDNMSTWGQGGDRGGEGYRDTYSYCGTSTGSGYCGICLTCTARALYVWVPRAAGLANWSQCSHFLYISVSTFVRARYIAHV